MNNTTMFMDYLNSPPKCGTITPVWLQIKQAGGASTKNVKRAKQCIDRYMRAHGFKDFDIRGSK